MMHLPGMRYMIELPSFLQIFLNGVSYCDIFPATNNSLNITGLAGNRLYEVYVEVYSVDKKLNPQTSNKLVSRPN